MIKFKEFRDDEVRGLKKITIAIIGIMIMVMLMTAACGGKEDSIMAQNGDQVTVHYTGTLSDGSVFDSSVGGNPISFKVGAGQMIAGFDAAVVGMKVGEKKSVTIPPEQAYGERNEEYIISLPINSVPEGMNPSVGDVLTMTTSGGQNVNVIVAEITSEYIKVDANHELAGKTLTFEIEMMEITKAK